MTSKQFPEKALVILKVLQENPDGILLQKIAQNVGIGESLLLYYIDGATKVKTGSHVGGYFVDIVERIPQEKKKIIIKLKTDYIDILKARDIFIEVPSGLNDVKEEAQPTGLNESTEDSRNNSIGV